MSRVPYASTVGSLMYVMVRTKPDLSFIASLVRRIMSNVGKLNWKAIAKKFKASLDLIKVLKH